MLRFLLIILIGFLLYKIIRNFLKKFFPQQINSSSEKRGENIEYNNIEEVEYREIKDDKNTNS